MSHEVLLGNCSLVIRSTTYWHFNKVTCHANQILLKCDLEIVIPIFIAALSRSFPNGFLSADQYLCRSRNFTTIIDLLLLLQWRWGLDFSWLIIIRFNNAILGNDSNTWGRPGLWSAFNALVCILSGVLLLTHVDIIAYRILMLNSWGLLLHVGIISLEILGELLTKR